ncbi:MAG: acyl-CoA thioesterase [Saprospiraceae bacterium]
MDLKSLSTLSSYPRSLESKYRVRFQDCDPYLHLNQSSYLDYFVNAREDHLRNHYGLDIYHFARENSLGWMVTKNQIAYLRQVMVNEMILVESHITSFEESSINVECIMWDEGKLKPKSLLWATYTFVNLTEGKRASHPEEINEFFSKIIWSGFEKGLSFEQRIGELYKIGK